MIYIIYLVDDDGYLPNTHYAFNGHKWDCKRVKSIALHFNIYVLAGKLYIKELVRSLFACVLVNIKQEKPRLITGAY